MNFDDHARSIVNTAHNKRLAYANWIRQQLELCQSLGLTITPKTTLCPACGQGLKFRVVEHPTRELGMDGQTMAFCMNCGCARVFNRALDEGRTMDDEFTPGVTGKTRGTMVVFNGNTIESVTEY